MSPVQPRPEAPRRTGNGVTPEREYIVAYLRRRAHWCWLAADRIWRASNYADEKGMTWYAVRSGAFTQAADRIEKDL